MALDISPTFRSGDYFAPMAKPKTLLPRRTVFVDGTTNEGVVTSEETGAKGTKGFPNRLAVQPSVNSRNTVSFSDSDTVV
ncbi:Hypothetical predicted protein [Paramuricea clavata]|uniref:Uncharacterized protein n=1 Tax=Paramuricea clavata TaxID=317549 RepID=A0A6S7GUM3_PARCT|nr:Hypothetical predicted protein [Paramuricea clavata]